MKFGFSFGNREAQTSQELPDIFPLSVEKKLFTKSDLIATYAKILADTLERTFGITDKVKPSLSDNCVKTDASLGLVHLLAEAMAERGDLYLVWKADLGVLRKATAEEQKTIIEDYKKAAKSKTGVYISFKHFLRTEMMQIYSELEYCVLASLHKTLNISKAVQIKINKLRETVSLADSAVASGQARSIASALERGKDVYMDKDDEVLTATPDTSTAEKAITFLDNKRAFILGLPVSYISGVQTGGIGSTGEADARAVERGLKQYFDTIIEPVFLALYGLRVTFKSQDFRQISTALEVLKTFELTSNEYITTEGKREITQRIFELDPKEEEKNRKKEGELEAVNKPTVPGQGQDPDQGDEEDEEEDTEE